MSVAVAIACCAREAAAERAVTVEAVGVALDARAVEAALRVRLPDGPAAHLRLAAVPGGVQITAGVVTRDVALGDRRGAEAVRLIALAASDLLLADLATAPVTRRTHEPVAMSVIGGVAAWDSALAQIAADVAVPRAGWLAAVELGGGQLVHESLQLKTVVARLELGLRHGVLEARAGVTVAPVFVATGSGDQTVLVGANLSGRVRVPLGGGVRGIAAVGLDAFANRTEYRMFGAATLTTPQLAPWLAAGVEVEL